MESEAEELEHRVRELEDDNSGLKVNEHDWENKKDDLLARIAELERYEVIYRAAVDYVSARERPHLPPDIRAFDFDSLRRAVEHAR